MNKSKIYYLYPQKVYKNKIIYLIKYVVIIIKNKKVWKLQRRYFIMIFQTDLIVYNY